MLSCVLQTRDELPHGFFLALECSSTPQKACRASSVKETVVVLTNHVALLLIQWFWLQLVIGISKSLDRLSEIWKSCRCAFGIGQRKMHLSQVVDARTCQVSCNSWQMQLQLWINFSLPSANAFLVIQRDAFPMKQSCLLTLPCRLVL